MSLQFVMRNKTQWDGQTLLPTLGAHTNCHLTRLRASRTRKQQTEQNLLDHDDDESE